MPYPNYIDPNAYSQYSTVPHDPGIAPSGAAQFLWNLGQYGVSALMPGIGSLVGAGMNMLGQHFQNLRQEDFYNQYMSPQARMSQMKAAGINPAAAAQGIAGASAPQMNAAPPTSAFTGIGEQLGNSVNTALSARNLMATNEDIHATIKEREASAEDLKASAALKNSQNVEQKITNEYKRSIMDKVVRDMDTKYKLDTQTLRVLTNDANFSDAVYDGRITQFWLSTCQMLQDLINAEEEHNLIIADINKRYSDIALNNAYIATEEQKQANIAKDTEIKEEDRRYKAFRRNVISTYHYDPESTVQQNIAFAVSIGDIETATYWAHTMAEFQATADGWSEEQKGFLTQQFTGYKGFLDLAKFMAGGYVFGSVANGGSRQAVEKTSEGLDDAINPNTGNPIGPDHPGYPPITNPPQSQPPYRFGGPIHD